MSRKIFLFSIIVCLLSFNLVPLMAAEYQYPELLVTPRASERLGIEAKKEHENRFTTWLPLQVSAVSTMAAGLLQLGSKDPTKDSTGWSPMAGIAVGGGWIATTALLSAYYRPYQKGLASTQAYSGSGTKDQLTRERLAEEAIDAPAFLSRRLMWLSLLTNAGASAYMVANVKSQTAAQIADFIAIGASLTPLLFPIRYQSIANDQASYKKKIYGPVSSGFFISDRNSGKVSPGVVLAFMF